MFLLFIALLQLFEMPPSAVVLNGERVAVAWNDADSFGILEGEFKDARVRLGGFNALESYGPVHQWGDWTPMELFKITKQATRFARTRVWTCSAAGERDHYRRLLVGCSDLTDAIVGEGLAHVFAVGGEPTQAAMAAQRKAIAEGKGMWAKGVPKGLITSLHSADERMPPGAKPYNRVAELYTGRTHKVEHEDTYRACEKVCVEGSCMLYVPFDKRYGPGRAPCLFTKGKW